MLNYNNEIFFPGHILLQNQKKKILNKKYHSNICFTELYLYTIVYADLIKINYNFFISVYHGWYGCVWWGGVMFQCLCCTEQYYWKSQVGKRQRKSAKLISNVSGKISLTLLEYWCLRLFTFQVLIRLNQQTLPHHTQHDSLTTGCWTPDTTHHTTNYSLSFKHPKRKASLCFWALPFHHKSMNM